MGKLITNNIGALRYVQSLTESYQNGEKSEAVSQGRRQPGKMQLLMKDGLMLT